MEKINFAKLDYLFKKNNFFLNLFLKKIVYQLGKFMNDNKEIISQTLKCVFILIKVFKKSNNFAK